MGLIKDSIRNLVLSPLGSPVLPREVDIQETDYLPALIRYYTAIPLRVERMYNMFSSVRTLEQKVNELLPNPDKNFFIGVLNYGIKNQVGQPGFDQMLLGLQYQIPMYDPIRKLALDTYTEVNTGDVQYQEHLEADEPYIKWITGAFSMLAVEYGYGQTDIDKVNIRHTEILANLVSITYYERLISIRRSGSFKAADFSVSTDFIEKKLEENKARAEKMLRDAAPFPIVVA